MNFKQKWLLAKLESVEDTDPTNAGINAILTRNLQASLYQGNSIERDVDRQTIGANKSVKTNPHNQFTFDVDLAGSGTAGTAAAYAPLLQACGFSVTTDATPGSESVTYNLVSDNYSSITLDMLRKVDASNAQAYKSTGVRGTCGFKLAAGELPTISFSNMMGTWYAPATITSITPDTSSFADPNAVAKDNTPTVTIDGFACVMQSFSCDLNNDVARRDLPGSRCTLIKDRSVSGQIAVRAPTLAQKDFFTALQAHAGITTVPLHVVHGTVAGHILDFSLPTVQLTSISETDIDGELGYTIDYTAIPSDSGDDELVLKNT